MIRHAQVNESGWRRDPADDASAGVAPWGIHQLDPAPWNRLRGPVAARGPASGLVEVGGRIVCSWGEPDRADYTFSVAKTYLALLAGVASRDGLMPEVDEPIVARVPGIGFDAGPARETTWRQMLQQTSEWAGSCFGVPDQVDRYRRVGFQPPPAEGDAVGTKGDARPLRAPGTFWEYNDVRINQLSLALMHLFREPLPEVFGRALMRPVGAGEDWSWVGYDDSFTEIDGRRVQSVPGGTHWGGGVRIAARDQLRLARMLLDGGRARGTQVLPAEWIRQMLEPCPIAPFYGYLSWLNRDRVVMPSASAESWFAIGAGSSIVWHDPSNDLVAVFRWIESSEVDGLVARVLAALDG
ncbi:MAG: serine hydrolase domain-containing protein [Lautropia sp.]